MKPTGILIFVDDDHDEYIIFKEALKTVCENEIIYASNGEEGLQLVYENKNNIFMIISDINMPKMNGLELKRIIEGTPILKIKSIPFIFRTSHDNVVVIKEAYSLGIQGLFIKAADLEEIHKQIALILKYWTTAIHPNILD